MTEQIIFGLMVRILISLFFLSVCNIANTGTMFRGLLVGVTASFTPVTHTYTTAGSYTGIQAEVVPTGATQLVFEAWGAGGSGRFGSTAKGGGGGGYIKKTLVILSSDWGKTIDYEVGAGGLSKAGTPSINGGAGGLSGKLNTNTLSTPLTAYANGGAGGTTVVGAGGSGVNGDIIISGASGSGLSGGNGANGGAGGSEEVDGIPPGGGGGAGAIGDTRSGAGAKGKVIFAWN